MKQTLFTLFLILFSFFSFSQFEMRINPYIKGEIIFKNDSIKNGYIKLNDSAFKLNFKKSREQKEAEKINVDSIEEIIIQNDSIKRVFKYRKTDASKFLKFVELIHIGRVDLYLFSIDNLSLFYKDVDRSNVNDFMEFDYNYSIAETKENLKKVISPEYLLDMKDSEKLTFIYSNRNLRKNSESYFQDCAELIVKIKSKEWDLKNIIDIVDFYNNCHTKGE